MYRYAPLTDAGALAASGYGCDEACTIGRDLRLVVAEDSGEDKVHEKEETEEDKRNEEETRGAPLRIDCEHDVGEIGGRQQDEQRVERAREGREVGAVIRCRIGGELGREEQDAWRKTR